MQVENLCLDNGQWKIKPVLKEATKAQLVTLFGDREEFINEAHFNFLKERYPNAHIVGCSSSGNIMGAEISSSPLVASAIAFESSLIEVQKVSFSLEDDIEQKAKELVSNFLIEGLKHIFVLADGLNLNGSKLVQGINSNVSVSVTGGLAGDGDRFEQTWVIGDSYATQKQIVAIGFYGKNLRIGTGCYGGWSEFGTFRTITKSQDNILYEIDNEPALAFYKRYLGEYAKDLPNSGLRFPLSIKKEENDPEIIRTLLGIDEENQSIIFAGDVPEGYVARLMKPNIDLLIEGAGQAAQIANDENDKPALGLVVSCVGRKIVLGKLIDDELEAVSDELGENVHLTGFYSYGEIAPYEKNILNCQLHNQTMTLTVIYEN